MNLPALKSFSGIHDLSVGIVHRFNKKDLKRIITQVNGEILSSRFWPFLAFSNYLFGSVEATFDLGSKQRNGHRLRCSLTPYFH